MPRNRKARNRKPPKNFLEALGSVEAVDAFMENLSPGDMAIAHPFGVERYKTRVAIFPQGKFRFFR
jgi:hypothetical protein